MDIQNLIGIIIVIIAALNHISNSEITTRDGE